MGQHMVDISDYTLPFLLRHIMEHISGERAPQSSSSNLLQDQTVLMTYYFFLMSDLNMQWHFGVKDMGNECLSALDEPH